jgi:hypothetical protein
LNLAAESAPAAETLWHAYLAARDRAERSRAFDDAREAGRRWAEFLDEFVR